MYFFKRAIDLKNCAFILTNFRKHFIADLIICNQLECLLDDWQT